MDASTCVEIACKHDDPALAAQALIDESTNQWIDRGDCMDDMTAIVLFLDNDGNDGNNDTSTRIQEDSVGAASAPLSESAPSKSIGKLIKDIESSTSIHSDEDDSGRPYNTGIGLHTEKLNAEKKMDVDYDSNGSNDIPLGFEAQFWTLFAGAASGFLGGLCGIRGPPLIFYFLHPPYPVSFNKKTQRATGASITATNVCMRIAYYLVEGIAFDGESYFERQDILLYISIVIFSLLGVLVGSHIFEYMKDSRATIRGILAIFLLLCGVSLLLSSFADV